MSAYPQTAEPAHTTDLPGTRKRRLVRAGIVTLCFLYVGVLLLLPLVGIVWTALEAGLTRSSKRSSGPTCSTRSS